MILTKYELNRILKLEKNIYFSDVSYWESRLTKDKSFYIYKYVTLLRKTEFYHNISKENKMYKFLYAYYRRKKNFLGIRLGIEMWDNSIGEGLTIYHAGNIVINGGAKIGKNLKLHGDNCIGNDGFSLTAPSIGDNVRLGVGAKVIGDVRLADNIVVAAGAVVVNSFTEPGCTVAGIPARKIK